jgi:hypothetical protein
MFLAWERNVGTEDAPEIKRHFINKDFPYYEDSFEAAKREAYNGEYEIYDDGQPAPVAEPTTDEILNAMLGVM